MTAPIGHLPDWIAPHWLHHSLEPLVDMVSLVADMHHLHPVVGRPCVARSPSDAPKPQRRPVVHVEAAIELYKYNRSN